MSPEILPPEQVTRQVSYWLDLADYDFETAKAMLASRRLLYVAFMCHQVIEKSLKAVFVSQCRITAPRVHALVVLAQKTSVYNELSPTHQEFLDELDPMNIECRYPIEKEKLLSALTVSDCERIIAETEGLFVWKKHKLSN